MPKGVPKNRELWIKRLKESKAKYRKPLASYICDNCGETFGRLASQMVGRKYAFCCKNCQYKFLRKKSSWNKKQTHNHWGENNPRWRGGRRVDKDGYILIYSPNHPHKTKNNCIREQRLIMEKHLGRYLDPKKEVVHHKDGNRANNQIENLQLMSPSEHLALHGTKNVKNLLGGD